MSWRRAAPVLVWLVAVAIAALIVARAPFATDMSAFLPRSDKPAQQVLVEQLTNGAVSHLILVALEGAPPGALAAMSKGMAGELRKRPDIVSVNNGEEAGLGPDRDYLWRNRYLLSAQVAPERFTESGLRAALENDLRLLGSQFALLAKRAIPADPTGEMLGLIDQLSGNGAPVTRDGVWVSRDASRALLMVQTRPAGMDLDAQEHILNAIRASFEAARAAGRADAARLVMTGPAVFGVSARATMKRDATRFSMLASGLVATVLFLAYRTPVLVGLAFVPVASGALAGIAAVALAFGFVHGITLGFGVTLIGEAVDYAIYLFTQTTPESPPRATLARIGRTLRLGLITSVVGFSAMLMSNFPGFVQLGLFTIAGLITALTVTVFVLPSLTPRDFQGARANALGPAALRVLRGGVLPGVLIVLAVTAAAAVLVLHRGSLWQDQLSSLNPVPVAEQKLDQQLRNEIGAPDVRYMAVISAASEEGLLVDSERLGGILNSLIKQGVLAGYDAPHLYLPSAATQAVRRAALPEDDALRAALGRAVEGLPFKADVFEPFLRDAARARLSAPLTQKELAETSLRLKVQSMMIERDGQWIGILPLRGVGDAQRLETALLVTSSVRSDLLDLKDETDRLLARYLREALTLAAVGSVAILVLLAINLRSLARVVRVAAPLAASVVITAALLVAWQQQLSIFNLFGLLLVVAVGSNYTLFFERASDSGVDADSRIVTSVVLANLCTVIGFGVLAFSRIPVLQGIGSTVAIGTFLSLLMAGIVTRRGRRAP